MMFDEGGVTTVSKHQPFATVQFSYPFVHVRKAHASA
jgi:hypothetical protein